MLEPQAYFKGIWRGYLPEDRQRTHKTGGHTLGDCSHCFCDLGRPTALGHRPPFNNNHWLASGEGLSSPLQQHQGDLRLGRQGAELLSITSLVGGRRFFKEVMGQGKVNEFSSANVREFCSQKVSTMSVKRHPTQWPETQPAKTGNQGGIQDRPKSPQGRTDNSGDTGAHCSCREPSLGSQNLHGL